MTYASLSRSGLNFGPNISASALFLDFYAFPCGSGQMWPDTHVHKQSIQQKKKKGLNIQHRHIHRLISQHGYCVNLCSRGWSKDIKIKYDHKSKFSFESFTYFVNLFINNFCNESVLLYYLYVLFGKVHFCKTTNDFKLHVDIYWYLCLVSGWKKDQIQQSENSTFCPENQFWSAFFLL